MSKKIVSELYRHWFDRIQVSMMKLPVIHRHLEFIALSDWSLEAKNEAYQKLVDKYKMN